MYYVLANPAAIWPWVIGGIVALVLFGGQKIPELMRGVGLGVKEFKKGYGSSEDEELRRDEERKEEIRRRVEEQMRHEDEERLSKK